MKPGKNAQAELAKKQGAVHFDGEERSPLSSRKKALTEEWRENAESIVSANLPPDFPLDQIELLNDILPYQLRIDKSGITRNTLDGDGGRKARLDLYASIIEHNCESQSPLVLILEDWEFADSLSWKLLFVVQQLCASNLFIIITMSTSTSFTEADDVGHDLKFLKANPDLIQVRHCESRSRPFVTSSLLDLTLLLTLQYNTPCDSLRSS